MDVKYDELKNIYKDKFTLSYLGNDISKKLALVSLVGYITHKLKSKSPDVSCWSILYKLNLQAGSPVPEDCLKGWSIICEDFAYGCSEFPTFDLKDKEIPEKIKEILKGWLPF